jgi:uncharacterized RDD family membrane protein YckC
MSDLINPYAAPKADDSPVAPVADTLVLNHASMGTRFLNALIDQLVQQGLAMGLGILLAALGISFRGGFLLGMVLSVIYYSLLEGAFAVTVGKLITGTRVVDTEGNRPSFGQIVGRTFSRLVPFDAFSFLSTPSVGWHDRWSGTRVVKIR